MNKPQTAAAADRRIRAKAATLWLHCSWSAVRVNECGREAGIKQRLIDATIVAAAFLTAIAFWTRNMIAIALLLPAGILLVRHRARSKAELQRREALALHSLAISLILPIIVVLALIFYFLWNLIPEIIAHWQ